MWASAAFRGSTGWRPAPGARAYSPQSRPQTQCANTPSLLLAVLYAMNLSWYNFSKPNFLSQLIRITRRTVLTALVPREGVRMKVIRMDREVLHRLKHQLRIFVASNDLRDQLAALKESAAQGLPLAAEAQRLLEDVERTRVKGAARASSIAELAKRFVKEDEYKDLGQVVKALSQMRGQVREEVRQLLNNAMAGVCQRSGLPSPLEVFREIQEIQEQAGAPSAEICAEVAARWGMQPHEVERLYWEGFSAMHQADAEESAASGGAPATEVSADSAETADSGQDESRQGMEMPKHQADSAGGAEENVPCEAGASDAAAENLPGEECAPAEKQVIYRATITEVLQDRLIVLLPTTPPTTAVLGVHRFSGKHRYLQPGVFRPGELIDVAVIAPRRGRQWCQVAPVDPDLLSRRLVGAPAAAPAGQAGAADGPADAGTAASPALYAAPFPGEASTREPGYYPLNARRRIPVRRTMVERLVDKAMEMWGEMPNDPVSFLPGAQEARAAGFWMESVTEESIKQDLRGSARSALVLLERALTDDDPETVLHLVSNAAFLLRSQATRCARLLQQIRAAPQKSEAPGSESGASG